MLEASPFREERKVISSSSCRSWSSTWSAPVSIPGSRTS